MTEWLNMSKWFWPEWAEQQVVRETGLVEDICSHGVGHPNLVWLKAHPNASGVHGCDGCCCGEGPKAPVRARLIGYGVARFPAGMKGWRCFRVEYGGHAENCKTEGQVWIPPTFTQEQMDQLEALLSDNDMDTPMTDRARMDAIRVAHEQADRISENVGVYQDLIGGITAFRVRPVTVLGAGILIYSTGSTDTGPVGLAKE